MTFLAILLAVCGALLLAIIGLLWCERKDYERRATRRQGGKVTS